MPFSSTTSSSPAVTVCSTVVVAKLDSGVKITSAVTTFSASILTSNSSIKLSDNWLLYL
ncbi:MAG: hypothetical protein AAF383_07440 [Cyanobacteria bacterium P01_A01_bin.83]